MPRTSKWLEGVRGFLNKGNTGKAYEECDRLALKYGFPSLPEGDNYGLTVEGKIVAPTSITPITNEEAFSRAIMSPAMDWIFGRR